MHGALGNSDGLGAVQKVLLVIPKIEASMTDARNDMDFLNSPFLNVNFRKTGLTVSEKCV